ncbi:MAG TPA: type III secretion inner membrane ring lipoprotein SctJ [Fibrobacteria bacterium]|nr:type III secretion inner membrane ring lipoprotein SctJ [Fibrobacteria bacterium]
MRKMIPCLSALFLAALCGCQENLYSDLEEKEATSMMAILMEKGVGCTKTKAKEGWDLAVDKSDLPAAVRILEREGYPRHEYKDLGQVFGSKGLISSPHEDRIRFIFALSQEIAETISQIDGVLTSRVHLVLPENDPLSDSLKPSSASVFVKYLPSSQVPRNTTQIKQLVLNGVEGLSMDKVSVVALPGNKMEAATVPAVNLAGLQLYRNSMPALFGIAAGEALLMLGLGYLAAVMVRQRMAAGKPLINLGKVNKSSGELAKL